MKNTIPLIDEIFSSPKASYKRFSNVYRPDSVPFCEIGMIAKSENMKVPLPKRIINAIKYIFGCGTIVRFFEDYTLEEQKEYFRANVYQKEIKK